MNPVLSQQVKDIVRDNLGKVIERGDKLDDLEGKAGECKFVPLFCKYASTL